MTPPARLSSRGGSVAWRADPSTNGAPPLTTVAALEKSDSILFCGWSVKRSGPANLLRFQRYFCLTKAQEMLWYESIKGSNELKLSGRLGLACLSAIKRERPTSSIDFTFRVVTEAGTVTISPGSRQAFQQWQEGLMSSVAVPSPQEQRWSMLKREQTMRHTEDDQH
jgi:hypothetical protein